MLLFKHMQKENGSVSVILAGVFGFLFVVTMVFGFWAFMSRQDYKTNVDAKIEEANILAVQEAETAKDAEFVEKEKLPTRTYRGPETYGSVSYEYPKTWSIYAEEAVSGTVLDLYAFPGVVPGIDNKQSYALRLEITSSSYDSEVKKFQSSVDKGEATSVAFRPDKVPSVLGVRIDGQIDNEKTGSVVILPLRDRTIKIYTELPQFTGDFNNIVLPTLNFVP